jgi:hypothetical protein
MVEMMMTAAGGAINHEKMIMMGMGASIMN